MGNQSDTITVKQGPHETEVKIRVVTVQFGNPLSPGGEVREFQIYEAPILRARKWRRAFADVAMPVLQSLLEASEFIGGKDGEAGKAEANLHQLTRFIPQAEQLLTDRLDEVVESLFLYSPELEAEREWVLENVTDRQALSAFWEVVKMAVPFDLERVSASGLMKALTSSKSPSPNGDTGPKKPKD
jgi:hypothetical protein